MYTVLIADDEDVERSVVKFLLEQRFPDQFQILQAANGRDALGLVRANHIDVLLSDIQMPFLSGIELAKEARAIQKDIELLFFSGFDDFEYVQSALILRAVNYVLKPLDPEQFYQAVSEILSRLDALYTAADTSDSYYTLTFASDQPSVEQAASSELTDPALLKQIELAVQLKQPDQAASLTNELLDRCADPSGRSHVYIRHLAADLLQIIIGGIPDLDTTDFDSAAEEIYTFRQFSEIREKIQYYLDLLLQELHREMDAPNYAVHRVKQYIEEHYQEELTLNFLADQVYLSPNYLSNMFTKVTGCSLNKYIKRLRMRKSRELLLNTNMKIADIGKAVGYPTTSYFIKTFQAMHGVTPMNYRLEHLPFDPPEEDRQ